MASWAAPRRGVKAAQLKYGLPADSWPTAELLARMGGGAAHVAGPAEATAAPRPVQSASVEHSGIPDGMRREAGPVQLRIIAISRDIDSAGFRRATPRNGGGRIILLRAVVVRARRPHLHAAACFFRCLHLGQSIANLPSKRASHVILRFRRPSLPADARRPLRHPQKGRGPCRRAENRARNAADRAALSGHAAADAPDPDRLRFRHEDLRAAGGFGGAEHAGYGKDL